MARPAAAGSVERKETGLAAKALIERLRPHNAVRALGWRIRGLGAAAGLTEYRPVYLLSTAEWTGNYRTGDWDYFADLEERARYSVVFGYLDHLGGSPTILDVGCGPGLLRERIGTREFGRYIGIDIAPDAIEQAGHLVDERTAFVCGDLSTGEIGPLQSIDVAVCKEVLYATPKPAAMLDRIHELVRPGGHLLASNMRHVGDAGLHRLIDERFERIDTVDVRCPGSRARRGWRVTCHRRR